MITTTPFHPRLSELNSQGLYTHWQGQLSALRYTQRAEARVLRGAQRGRRLRHLAAVQVPRHRPGRRAAAVGRAGARHPHLPTGPGAVHRVVRRPRLRDARRRGVPALRRRVPAHRRPARALVVPGAGVRAAGASSRTSSGDLRDARRPGSALARRARRADARGRVAGVLRPRAGQGRRHRGHPVAHRLHRRPRLRDHRRGRQRGRRARRGARGRRRRTASARSGRRR